MSRHSTVGLTVAVSLALAALGGCSGRGTSSVAPAAGTERIARVDQPIPDRYLVVLAPGDATADVAAAAASVAKDHGATVLNVYQHALRGFSMRAALPAAGAVALDPRVERVEQDGVARAAALAWQNGPTWGLDRVDQRGAVLDGRYAWDDRWTGAGVDAFVLDTGVLTSHLAFGGRASFAFDALGEGATGDCSGHGTHVAGTIAGGPYGVAKGARVRSVRVLDCSGNGSASSIVAGLDWVIANHADAAPAVANLSLFAGPSSAIDAAVEAATAHGIVVVAAAGDGGKDACDVSPARAPSALTVAAMQQRLPGVVGGKPVDELAPYSNGGDCVDFVAPGTDVVSAWNTSAVADLARSGTSMAAPHVAGAVALYLSRNPAATPADVVRALVASATRGPAGAPGFTPDRLVYTRGVELTPADDDVAPTVAITAPVEGDALTGSVSVAGTASDDYGLTRVELLVDGRWRGSSDTSPFEIPWDTSTSLDGAHSVVVRAYDTAGHATDSTAIAVTVSNPGVAHLDAALRIARCETLAASCDSGDLVRGRAALGPERYAPSVLRDPCDADPAGCLCRDGELGVYLLDESVEHVRISSADGKPFATGGNVKLEVDAIVGPELGDLLDLYASPAVSPPSWRHVITLEPVASGPQTLTAWYTLPAGGTQAVRAAFRHGGDAGVCTPGGFDDRDDLAFVVGAGTVDDAPPTVKIVAPSARQVLEESATVEVAAADDRLVSKVMVTADDWKGKTYPIAQLTASPYAAAWNPALLPNGEYVLRAIAHDGAGNTATDEVAVTLADLTGPAVAIVEPLDAASLPSNLIKVKASATDAGAVMKVDLLVNDLFQGSDVAAPWGFELRAPANGTYVLRARGTDLQGNRAESAPVTVTVNDVTPPDVKVLAPAEGAAVPKTVTFSVDPTDDSGIAKVEFFLDGVSLGTSTGAPWEIPHDFSRAPNGSYVFSATAQDGVGNVGTASVTVKRDDRTPPTVRVTAPASNTYLSGLVELTADASDEDGAVKRVEYWLHVPYTPYGFKVGETAAGAPWKYVLAASTVPSGTYLLYAQAFDFAENVGDSKAEPLIRVRTGDVTPPTTAVVAPVAGLTKVAGAIGVTAEAADAGGALAKVELRVDDVAFATFTAPPFQATLDTTSLANGDHVLTSKAYDTAGNVTVSDPVAINVLNPGATFDPVAGAPACDVVSSFCHTGILLMGRGMLGPEANASNTVDGCPDGTEGVYRVDESIEHVAISTLDGALFTGGKLARVDVRAFVADPKYDRLDVYVAADPAAPQFVLRATVEPAALVGEQNLSATVPLAYSERQVVRVALRGGGLPEACGTTGYDDRDDVVIAALPGTPDTTPPSVAISAPSAGEKVRDVVEVLAAASDDVGVEHVAFEVDDTFLSSDDTAPFSATWNTSGLVPGTYTLTAVAFDYSGNSTRSAPVSVEVEDVVKPTATITTPVDGETASGTITIQVTASDNVGVTEVKLVRLDEQGVETAVATDGAAPWSFSTSVAALEDGKDYRFVARAYDAGKNVGESAAVTVHVALTGLASFDKKLKAPKCALPGARCWTGGLVVGRGPLGPEPSAPNTIAASCPDGGSGFFHSDESMDVIAVRALDPAGLKEGGRVRIEAKIWATVSYGTDALDVYVAPDALAPAWRWVATLTPARAGAQVLGFEHVLGPGALQAVRVQLRHAGTEQPCSTGAFDDRDDLAFAVSK